MIAPIEMPWHTLDYKDGFILMRWRETVYDENYYLRIFETEKDAQEWAEKNLSGRFEWDASSCSTAETIT